MIKLNLLQKLAPTGIAALSVITATAGSMLLAPSAQAQAVSCFSGLATELQGASVQCLDKLFDNFSIDPALPIVEELAVSIGQTAGGTFFFNVNAQPLGVQGPFDRTINYDITINQGSDVFDTVGFDTDIDQIVGDVEAFKEVGILDVFSSPDFTPDVAVGDTLTLVSINGDPAPDQSILGATKISISDTIQAGVNSTVFSATNVFTQEPPQNVPEPSAMLGLLALGGLGLGLKRKKQS
jgi:hypothetical protein